MIKCEWCQKPAAKQVVSTVYWELPDGTRAIEIRDTPGLKCYSCEIEYQEESIIEALEDQLLLVDTTKIESETTYEYVMSLPRLLKRNYFRFD